MSLIYRLLDRFTDMVFGPEPKEMPVIEPDWVYIGKKPMPGEKNGLVYEARKDRRSGKIQYYIPEGNVWM